MELYSGVTLNIAGVLQEQKKIVRLITEIKFRLACKLLFKAMETLTLASRYKLPVTILVYNLEYVLSTFHDKLNY